MLRYGLRLLVEPLYDSLHGIARDIFRGMSEGAVWIFFLVMKLLYTFNYGPWNGAKNLVEGADIIREVFANPLLRKEVKVLWDSLRPGMCRDVGRMD